MDKFLAQFSKNTLAVAVIAGGMIFIILNSPPRSICDAQINQIRESQKLFLFKEKAKKGVKVKYLCYRKRESLVPLKGDDRTEEEYACSKYQSLRDRCKRTNDPGGCYELFQGIKILLSDLSTLTRNCAEAASGIDEVRAALKETLDLIVRLAWGEKPPSAYHAKFGWLDTSDLSLFCKLKARYQNTYGEEAWNRYRQKTLEELPGAKELSRNEVWDLSIFSENCARYP